MPKILVTGANGFVGHNLVNMLTDKNFPVVATGKGAMRNGDKKWNYHQLDFTNETSVKKLFAEVQPTIIIHCGAVSKPDECEQNRDLAFNINVEGTNHLLKYAEEHRSFFIFLSTDFVFDGSKGMYKEDDERAAVNYYGQTKILAENKVMNYSFNWCIVRTVLVYGKPFPGRSNLLTMVSEALKQNKPLKIFGDQLRTPTYVEDLCKGIIAIVENQKTGIFHLSGKDKRTPFQVAVETAKYLGLNEALIREVEEKDFDQPARRPLITGFDISKAEKELGYGPLSFAEGLKKTFE